MDHRPHIVVVEDEATQRQAAGRLSRPGRISASAASMAAPRCVSWWSATCPSWCCSTSDCPARMASRWRAGCARGAPGGHHHGHGRLRHGRPRARARNRRRRLHRQAVRAARAAGAGEKRAAPRDRRAVAISRRRACAWAAACSISRSACWSIPPTAARSR